MDKSGSSGSGSQSQSTSTPRISVLIKRKPQYIQTEEYYEDYCDDDPDIDADIGLEEIDIEEEIEEEEGEEDSVELDTQHMPSVATLASRVGQRKKSNRTKGPSPAWNDAIKVNVTDESGNKTVMAECNHCKIQVPAESSRHGTKGILNHLKKCPESSLYEAPDSKQPLLSQGVMGGQVVAHTFNQKRLDMKCVKWIIKAEMPFRAVDQEDFRDWIHDLNPKYKLPNRHKVAAAVLELYFTEMEKIKRVVDGLRGDDIGRCLEVCLNKWGIDKVFSITVDNASANDTAIAYMKRRLKSNGTLLLDGAHLHMRCACHILNLIVKDGMTELSREIEGIRNCVKFIHSSPARLETFREYCILMRFDKMSNIPFDVVTRWNATYEMLNSAFKFKQVFARMADECNTFISYFQEEVSKEINGVTTKVKRVGPPMVEDWERAVSFAHFLKKFYDATLTLSATLTPTSNLILGTVIALQVEIEEKICNSSNATLQNVATSMKLKFDKYWGDIEKVNPILFIAQALDPRYKFEMLEASLEELRYSCEAILDVKTSIKKNLTDLYKAYKEGDVSSSSSVTMDQRPSVVVDDSSGLEDDVATRMQRKIQQKRAAAQQNEISNEVDMYFNDPHQSLTYEGFNILDWWKVNIGTYPTLSKVAKDIFALPSSTVASENAFSLGGRVVDPFRASLTPRTVEALVCTSDWLRGNEMSFYKEPTIDDLMFYKELEDLEKELPNMGMGGEENPTQSEMPPPPPPQVQRRPSLPPRPPISRASTPTQRRVQLSTRGRGPPSTPTSTGHSSTRGRGRRG
ncbi:hypothetical protein ACFX13_005180 [Malus domestica]